MPLLLWPEEGLTLTSPDYHYVEKTEAKKYFGVKMKQYYTLFNQSRMPQKAESILDRKTESLIGRKIIQYSLSQGDYDDGSGPGFFGLLLEDPKTLNKEWMILTVIGSDKFLLMDNKWVGTSVLFYDIQKPLISNLSAAREDNFGPLINGTVIEKVELTDQKLILELKKNSQSHMLEILNEDKRLSSIRMLPQREQDKIDFKDAAIFPSGNHLGEYLVFMEEDGNIYV